MAKGISERIRMYVSRIALGLVGALLLFSTSAWEGSLFESVLFMAGCVLVAIGTIGRLWSMLYIAGRKTTSLVTVGPYSLCRNPLYLFSFIGGLGVALATETLTIPLLFLVSFALYYPWVIRSEERRLREAHGPAFDEYCRTTPAFWPRFSLLREETACVVDAVIFRKHISDALWFVWLVGGIEFVEGLHEQGIVHVQLVLH